MGRVLFALEWLPNYRRVLLSGLRDRLSDDGVELNLVHGQPPRAKQSRSSHGDLEWAEYRENRIVPLGGFELVAQPVHDLVRQHDVVVVQQESRLLLNLLLASRVLRPKKGWAMWGHGQHFNPNEVSGRAEKLKAWETRRTDHFFAYTETSAKRAIEVGLAPASVTVVNNTVPPSELGHVSGIVERLAEEISSRTSNVGVMMSALDEWKRLPFLVEVLEQVKAVLPDFEFIVIGAGDDAEPLQALADRCEWLHLVGPLYGADKARLAEVTHVTIHPGLVGLHVVDSFRARSPMVTTAIDYHSHELDYLESGENGVVCTVEGGAGEVTSAVIRILTDMKWRNRLIEGGERTVNGLTVESSIERFACGLLEMVR